MAGKKPRGKRTNVRVLLTILGVIAILAAGSVGYAAITGKIGKNPADSSSQEASQGESKSAENSTAESSAADSSKPDSSAAESSKADSSKAESSKTESSKESSKQESSADESSAGESSAEESKEESSEAQDSSQEESEEESSEEESYEESHEEYSEPEESDTEDPSSHETEQPSYETYDCTYLVRVNLSTNVVTVYAQDSNGSHTVPVRAMLCSPGPDTPTGTYEMKGKWDILEMVGDVWAQYVSQIIGNYLFHSIPSDEGYYQSNVKRSVSVYEFLRQGTSCSHGCIRLYAGDAYWLYYNTVGNWTSYNPTMIELGYYGSGADPWGTPAKLGVPDYYSESTMWDPTDPSDDNPWKYPYIDVPDDKRSITLNAGDPLPDLLEGVKGYDGCGYDISYDIEVINNVNTWAPGEYTITYTLTNYYGYYTEESITITVKSNPVTGVTVDDAVTVEVGKTVELTVAVQPDDATNQSVIFTSSDENIATVEYGVVTGVAPGTATITVTSDDNAEITAECVVTVIPSTEESSKEESSEEESSKEDSSAEESSKEESSKEEDPGDNPGENTGEDPGENPGENTGENPGENPGENTGEDPGENPGENTGENPGETPGENTGENPGENPGENTGENPGENPGENTGENPGENPGENTGENPSDNPGENTSENLEENPEEHPDDGSGSESKSGEGGKEG